MKIEVKIYISDKNSQAFLGRGPVELLEKISESGSINKAASEMGMSYSKAHGLITVLEKKLGVKMLEKAAGGPKGGGSRLTGRAKQLIKKYRSLEKDIKHYARRSFRKTGI